MVYFTLKEGALNDRPDYAKIAYWMIKDENSNVGKQQYSMTLAAHATGKTVTVKGMNTCGYWADGENVNTVQIRNP